jgi:hypothetical protein
MVFTN